jgi:uncharacterized protein involved in exopolysaccharide biosynthesis
MLDLAFRHKILLVLPMVLGLIGGIGWFALSYEEDYVSRAILQVSPSSYVPSTLAYNPYLSPAENQANTMNPLLGTETFTTNILAQANKADPNCLHEPITKPMLLANTSIYAHGDSLLNVDFRSDIPCVGPTVVTAITDQYRDYYVTATQSTAARDKTFFEEQATLVAGQYDEAQQALRAYLQSHPELAGVNLNDPSVGALSDAGLQSAVNNVTSANDSRQRITATLAQIEVVLSGAETVNFYTYDEPTVPSAPVVPGTRDMLTKPMLGILLGMFASAAVFLLLWRMDKTVRLPSDLAFLQTSAPIMTLPDLNARRRKWPPSFVRLATAIQNGMTHFG